MMSSTCTNCGFQNPPGMRFCGNCGTRFPEEATTPEPMVAGLVPATPQTLGVLFGTDLQERFRQAGLQATGQRRHVTVLFVDLTGFTHLAEELDDEALYDLVQRFIQVLVDDVYKYEGMVDKLTGDGLMALFGAPIAHENNAERALRCAWDMLQDVGLLSREKNLNGRELRLHIGIHSGSVIVGGMGGSGLMNYTAIGDSVNLARRLEEAAEPGMILVSERVMHQTERLFDFGLMPPQAFKNMNRSVQSYRVIGLKDNPGQMRGIEGLRAPMIGRENELRQVLALVDRLVRDGQGGVVLLTGEGGIGKSRLTAELKARLDYSRLRVMEGHSLTYRKAAAFWIIQDLLRGYLGLAVDSAPEETHRRLSEVLFPLFGEAGAEKLPYLEYLLGGAQDDRLQYLDAEQLRQQIFLAVRDVLLAEALNRPLLLILEDLHWADDASLDFVRFLLESTRAAPMLIYAISRPFEGSAVQSIHERSSQRLAERYLYIRLQALAPDQSAKLLYSLLAIPELPETLREQIISRSAGLPFYLEEILRMLIEAGVIFAETGAGEGTHWRLSPGADLASIGVPETIQGLILTRFDRLPPQQRRVLQTASVVGYQFNLAVLCAILTGDEQGTLSSTAEAQILQKRSDSALRKDLQILVDREFISIDPDGENYQFKHVLVSDAVYSTLLQRDRRELHTRAGQAIEQIYGDRLESQIEVLAGHYLRSPLQDRALHYLILAGQKAARSYANEQARQYYMKALELISIAAPEPEQAVKVYLGFGEVLLTAGEYLAARDHFTKGLDVIGARPGTGSLSGHQDTQGATWEERKRLLGLLQRMVGRAYEGLSDYDRALSCLDTAQRLLGEPARGEDTRFAGEQAHILNDLGWIHFRRGSLDKANAALQEALILAETSAQIDIIASVLNRLAGIAFQRDDLDQAARYLGRSLALREQIGDVTAVARSYNNLGLLDWKRGNLAEALENFTRSFSLQANLGDVEGLIVLHTNMGLIELDRGNFGEAERHFQQTLASAGEIGNAYHVCMARMHLALLNVYAENWRSVLEHGQQGLSGFQELGVRENVLDLQVMLGYAYLGLGEAEHIEDVLTHIRELLSPPLENAESGSASEGAGRALRLFGSIAQARGDFTAAKQSYEESAAIFGIVNSPMERSRVLVDLAAVDCAMGASSQARALLEEARQVFTHMGAAHELRRVEAVSTMLVL